MNQFLLQGTNLCHEWPLHKWYSNRLVLSGEKAMKSIAPPGDRDDYKVRALRVGKLKFTDMENSAYTRPVADLPTLA
jgi:hypothetical protein